MFFFSPYFCSFAVIIVSLQGGNCPKYIFFVFLWSRGEGEKYVMTCWLWENRLCSPVCAHQSKWIPCWLGAERGLGSTSWFLPSRWLYMTLEELLNFIFSNYKSTIISITGKEFCFELMAEVWAPIFQLHATLETVELVNWLGSIFICLLLHSYEYYSYECWWNVNSSYND